MDRAPHLHGESREVRAHARRDQLRRGRRGPRRHRRDRQIRHRTLRGLPGLQLRHRQARLLGAHARAQVVPRHRDQGPQALHGVEARFQRPARRVLRPDARDVRLRGQGVHPRLVRRVAAHPHG